MDKVEEIKPPKPECPFCKQVRELIKGGLGMIRIGK